METHTKRLDDRGWDGRVVDYSIDSISFRMYRPGTRKACESRNVAFIEAPSVMPTPDGVSGYGERTFSYDERDDLVRDVGNYTSHLEFDRLSSENHASDGSLVYSLLEQLNDVAARDLRVAPAPSAPGGAAVPASAPSPTPAPVPTRTLAPAPVGGTPARGRGRAFARG